MSASTPVLVAECVSKSFGTRRVLSSATLRAHAGVVCVLYGRNGAGKSTLLKIAAGLLAPDNGVVHLHGGARLRTSLPQFAREGVYWLPDAPVLANTWTVRTQLDALHQRFGGPPVDAVAAECGTTHVLDHRPLSLSGGEARRAELAAAMVRAPQCLLADEPLRGVAPVDAESIGVLLRRLAQSGCAVVITGHDTTLLDHIADRVTWCTAGTTYELGTPQQALSHDAFRREYHRG